MEKNPDPKKAAEDLIKNQAVKCSVSGFLTGVGGVVAMPAMIPVNLGSVIWIQIRMIACIAYLGGYDLYSDQVQTLIYACLAGVSVNEVVKQAGVKIGIKGTQKAIEKIPGKALVRINQKIGFRFITKFGEKGIINLGKFIPFVGALINGGFDFTETQLIANRALKMFFEGDYSAGDKDTIKDDIVSTEKIIEEVK